MNEKLKGSIWSEEWAARPVKYQFQQNPKAEKPYVYEEYPKHITVEGKLHVVKSAEEEEALLASIQGCQKQEEKEHE